VVGIGFGQGSPGEWRTRSPTSNAMFKLGKKDREDASRDQYVVALRQMIEGRRDEAFRSLQRAVKGGKVPADAYIRLGNLLRERGDVSRATQIHQSLTVKDDLSRDERVELYLSLAEDFAALGRSEKSAKTLEMAVRSLGIKDPRIFVKIAHHHHVLGESDTAYEALKEARKLEGISDRELALYLTTVAERLIEQQDSKEAKRVLQRSLKHDPDCAPSLLLLGDLALKTDDVDEAIEKWRRAAILSPQLAETALKKLEKVMFQKGRFNDIEEIYNEVRSVRGGDEAAVLGIAGFYTKKGRGEEAIQLLEEHLSVFPESARARLLLASLYARYRESGAVEHFLDESIAQSRQTRPFICRACQFQSKQVRWHCPRCSSFDSFAIDHEM
jgi:lipopolysaccharide biosynthesis regulator YciM